MKILFDYAKKYKKEIFLQLIFASIWVFSQLVIPGFMAQIIDRGIMVGDMNFVLTRGGFMVIASLINVLSLLVSLYFLTHVTAGISRDMRGDLFEKAIGWSKETRQNFSTSTLITRNINDVKQVSNFIDMSLRKLFTLTLTIVGSVFLAFSLDATMAAFMFLIIPFVLIITSLLTSRAVPQYSKIRSATDSINRLFRQNMTGIRVVKAFGKSEYEKRKFGEAVEEAYDANVKAEGAMMLLAPLVMLFVNILVLFILWFGGVRVESGLVQVGVLVAIIEYVTMALNNVQSFATIITIVPRAKVSLERIEEVLNTKEVIGIEEGESKDLGTSKAIEVRGLTFNYPGALYPAIENASFTLNKGETKAIIGATGSGKSTLLRLLMRDYEATSGEVIVAGKDIKDLKEGDFNNIFTIIPQRTFLFSGTIRENIQMGKEDASDEEVWKVLDLCDMGEFFRSSEDGLDTHIAQNAVNLSGGQKQRISLARGIIRESDYYVFDDCFSALDFATDKRIREGMREYLKGKGVLIVAQRIATVENADEILVMDDGEIVDKGTHDFLIDNSKIYQEIFSSQIREE
ncbi:MAG: ABC transporter ATP-binding protein [Tissierellia bacterium]|nr:ABC transporter ATP-binding protein [Tissierellia bacterium]